MVTAANTNGGVGLVYKALFGLVSAIAVALAVAFVTASTSLATKTEVVNLQEQVGALQVQVARLEERIADRLPEG